AAVGLADDAHLAGVALGVAVRERRGAVGRAVVDDEDLDGRTESDERVEGSREGVLRVVRGGDDGDERRGHAPTSSCTAPAASVSGTCLKITLKIGKNTQKEIAELMIIVTKSARVSPVPPRPHVVMKSS